MLLCAIQVYGHALMNSTEESQLTFSEKQVVLSQARINRAH